MTSSPVTHTELRSALGHALSLGGRPVQRLATLGTSIAFRSEDGPGATLLLDRDPPAVADEREPAEITVVLDDGQLRAFLSGQLVLPNAALRHEITWSGPLRKYLTGDVVLRRLLARAAEAAATNELQLAVAA